MSITNNKGSEARLEKKRKGGFWLRKWDLLDLTNIFMFIGIHMLATCAPFMFNWGAIWVALVIEIITGLGVTIGYHRLLTHKSFKIPKWLEYIIVYCGLHSFEKDPIFWVSVHKNHHMYVDTEKDPHTPTEGFWFCHIGWLFDNEYIAAKVGESRSGEYSNVPELKAQWFYMFLHSTYILHLVSLAILLYIFGGFPYLAWAMGMRVVVVNHVTYFVNSVGHTWGERPWNTLDTSTNNWWVAMLSFGEGWHNNHHAFPKSARHGMEWWQFDATWEIIKFLETIGLATDIKLPTEADKERLKVRSETPNKQSVNRMKALQGL
nr:fatty acid desaturase, type 1 [Tanacetum cinerariifolium]